MRTRMLVSTANKESGWDHSTTSGNGRIVLNIYRMKEDGTFLYHPKWNGKVWKYKTFEQLQKIHEKLDQIGLLCGSLTEYVRN